MLTEAVALHDRRVRDSATDTGINNDVQNTKSQPTADPDFDQFRVPQGSVFFELYAPRKNNNTQGNYYSDTGVKFYQGGQLNLGAMSPSGTSGGALPGVANRGYGQQIRGRSSATERHRKPRRGGLASRHDEL